MSRRIIKWKLDDLIKVIVATLLNKYDYFLAIEGNTGVGKSTLAFHIASRVSLEFKRLYQLNEELVEYYYERVGRVMGLSQEEFVYKILLLKQNKEYKFYPRSALIYTQDELLKYLTKWHNISISDEAVNVAFNRDFFSEKQKDIIKCLNMFRDHENLTIACVPQFQVLDNQVKNLCKMKLTVKKRGVAIVHTPNQTIYCKDKWDQATNEKIEREWIIKKNQKPNFSKLTTFRGVVKFPALSKKQEALYQEIKNKKRSIILKDDMHIQVSEDKTDNPFQKVIKMLIDGSIKDGRVIDGTAIGMGLTSDVLRGRLRVALRKMNKPDALSHYYWDKKAKNSEDKQEISAIAQF